MYIRIIHRGEGDRGHYNIFSLASCSGVGMLGATRDRSRWMLGSKVVTVLGGIIRTIAIILGGIKWARKWAKRRNEGV
ncbi:transmembrane protein, putative [Medicago truncatula]|uniref:Transmembrane protein, putative n=1 Tax=Medicago truncatula TaxID=3880 RepID=G7JTY9_MEDTR|nr:transmembrane protein, putative [Medicago truncatula]